MTTRTTTTTTAMMAGRLRTFSNERSPLIGKHVVISAAVLLAHVVHAAVNVGMDPGLPTSPSNDPPFVSTQVREPKSRIETLTGTNCTPAAIEQFPPPLISYEQRRHGWLAVHVVIAIYMFVSLSILCEEYFVPAIEVITDSLQIDPDVAGATFMAAASSVPAIAASIIAILVAKGDLGVSTALGSAVLNAAGVVSVSALFAGKVVTLHRWPMYRDSLFFLVSVIILLLIMYDDIIKWYEAAVLVSGYFVYAIMMSFDAKLEQFLVAKFSFLQDRVDHPEGMFPPQITIEDTSSPVATTICTRDFDASPPGFKCHEKRVSLSPFQKSVMERSPAVQALIEGQRRRLSLISLKRSSVVNEQIMSDESIKNQVLATVAAYEKTPLSFPKLKSPFVPPENHLLKIFWLLYLPFSILFYITIPNCQKKRWRRYFLLTFIMSTLYITMSSYLLVWMITIIGFTLNVSDTVMGLTFLSIGVTLPDIVSSLLVVRKGFGDMAVCNAIGSNTFEILIGLGLPWLIKSTIIEPGMPIVVVSKGMMYSTICLILTLFFLIALTHWNRWRMNRFYGAVLMMWYLTFLALSCTYELGYFGHKRHPTCPSDY